MTLASLARFRALFPALEAMTHLDVAARSPLSREVRDAATAHLDERLHGTARKEAWFEAQGRAREAFARLVGASPGEIAVVKNVSEGISAVASSVAWRPGDGVVLCSAFEHANNVIPWAHLMRRGVRVADLPPGPGGALPAGAMIAALDPGVRVMAVSSVSFAPGVRADLRRLGEACRARDVLLLVDAAQSVGILRTDVGRDMVDVLVTGTQKGLTGLYGLGFLYVREAWAERLVPAHLARFGVAMDGRHEADHDATEPPTLAPGARRFEAGNPNFPGLVAAEVAMRRILEIGPDAIEEGALALAASLRSRLGAAGLPVVNPEGEGASHILTVGGPGFPAASLHTFLDERGVKASLRKGAVRFAFHGYNDETDVDRAVAACSAWQQAA